MLDTTPENDRESPLRKPAWLRRPIAFQGKQRNVQHQIETSGLHTVCKEAHCPNRSECYAQGTATFLVMGSVCTRGCVFCSVDKGTVGPLDWLEIGRVVEAARGMALRHTVITSVTRDDLPDGGAGFFAALVGAFRKELPGVTIELLIPDLKGDAKSLETVFASKPDILNHNVETVPSLYGVIRPQADYNRSLMVLRRAKASGLITKSGLMVGMGESPGEIFGVIDDLHDCGCSSITIGQYLQPSPEQFGVVEYVSPGQFEAYKVYGEQKGIALVAAGPFVRSSYHAAGIIEALSIKP